MRLQKHIFLIGFSGSGKSTIGRTLAVRFKYRFVDLDAVIERHTRQKISKVFAKRGERVFRRIEVERLRQLLRSERSVVIALGGGAFETAAVRDMARQHGVVVFLNCSQRELCRRLRSLEDRPLLIAQPRPGETPLQARRRRIRELLKKRLANYRTADLILSTTEKSVAQSALRLEQLLKTKL